MINQINSDNRVSNIEDVSTDTEKTSIACGKKVEDLLSINDFDSLSSYLGLEETSEMSKLRNQAIENMKKEGLGGEAYKRYDELGKQLILQFDLVNNSEIYLTANIALELRKAYMYYQAGLVDFFNEDIDDLLLIKDRVLDEKKDEDLNKFYEGLRSQIRSIRNSLVK